jgi:uroporphyrin-III C-methyltransferase
MKLQEVKKSTLAQTKSVAPPLTARPRARGGRVYLVGAGPGNPELITVKGLWTLRRADVVVFDRLVHPALLDEVPPHAERIFAGKRTGQHHLAQEEINKVLIARARAGLTVVRLKGGDPFVFGRGGEECESLHAAGIPVEVVPGVSAAVAVPALAGIPVTHRRYASCFAVITGHECDGASDLDWDALARLPTLVVLMGLRRLQEISDRLVAAGTNPQTPAAVIASGSLPEQRTIVGTLATIGTLAEGAALGPPATLIIGEVVRVRNALQETIPVPFREELDTVGAAQHVTPV